MPASLPAEREALILAERIDSRTKGIAQDLPEAIALLEELLPKLRDALASLYPGRDFIREWPAAAASPQKAARA